jgi:hypothetical protein
VCGICSLACVNDASFDCEQGPPFSRCFADGSFGFAGVCATGEAAGICLTDCRANGACEPGLVCRLGACVPMGAGMPVGSDAVRVAQVADECDEPVGGWTSYRCACEEPGNDQCYGLEEALRLEDECWNVWRGCGALHLRRSRAGGRQLWFDADDGTPFAISVSDDIGVRWQGTDRPVQCEEEELLCATCGSVVPQCEVSLLPP